MTTLSTPRLQLAPCTAHDSAELHALWTNADVRRFLWDDTIIAPAVVDDVIAESDATWRAYRFGMWCVRAATSTNVIGFAGFRFRQEQARGPELLYGFHPSVWGKGYAHESVCAALRYAFDELELPRVWAATDPPNIASVRVLARAGFAFQTRTMLEGMAALIYTVDRAGCTIRKAQATR